MYPRHSSNGIARALATGLLAMFAAVSLAVPVLAQGQSRINMTGNAKSAIGDSLVHTTMYSALGRPGGANQLDHTFPGGKINYGSQGETDGSKPRLMNPGTVWPELTPPFPTNADERTAATFNELARVTGVNDPKFGAMPATAMGVGLSLAAATQLQADYEADPQNSIDRAKEEQNQANQTSADNNAQMERNQAGAAIDFVASYLYNFTVEANNKWNTVRNQLFLPMALLLLLPGVVLAQLKATVSAGTPVINDITSPFDGILRAIVGIFLIPGTYLFINYGIDVSNAITFTIQDQYHKIFGTDMYKDAMCAHIRAFPYRNQKENLGYVPNQEADMTTPLSGNNDPNAKFAQFETKNLEVALRDPCAKLNKAPANRANEIVPHVVNAQRNSYNTGNSALAMTWNILCAFQMAYLYYLWFVGPVIAALWVYPMKELRDAFPAWINGVCTICFWSLFWNTTVLLMACCRGVDETGTLIMSALNFLSTACVKFAFDFAGLVRDAGMQAAQQASQQGGAGKAGGQGAQGAAGKNAGGHHTHGGGHPNVPSYATHNANAMPGRVTTAGDAGSGGRTVASASPFSLDASSPGGGDARSRSLLGSKQDGGAVAGNVPVDISPPPTLNGAAITGGAKGLADHAHLLNSQGSPLSLSDYATFTGAGGGAGADGADGGDGSGSADIDFNNFNIAGAGAVGVGAGGVFNGAVNAGGIHNGGAGAGAGGAGDINHAHHNAMHLSQNDLQNLFMNSPQAQQVRDQLNAQMSMPGGPGGIFVDGSNGASAFVGAAQLNQAFNIADNDTNISVASALAQAAGQTGVQGFDLPSASFSGLNMSPIDAAASGGGSGFVPPGSDPSMSRGSLDAGALASASGIPMSSGGAGNGVVPPDVAAAQKQATLDKISNEVNSSISTITAQNQAQAQAQAQAVAQQQMQQAQSQQLAQVSAAQAQVSQMGNGAGGGGFPGAGGGAGPMGNDLTKQALNDMAAVYRSSADIVNPAGGTGNVVGASGLGNIDTSGATYAASSAINAAGAGASAVAGGGVAPNQLPTNMVASNGPGPNGPGGPNDPNNPANRGESASQFLSRSAQEAWTGKDGFENRMVNASIQDQSMARASTNDALTHGNTLQGHVQGSVQGGSGAGAAPQIDNSSAGMGGYTAAAPTNYASASYTGGGTGTTGSGAFGSGASGSGTANAGVDPLAKESMDKLAQTFKDYVPEVKSMGGRSEVAPGGLGTGAGGGYDTGAGGGAFAQNSAMGQNVQGYNTAGGGAQQFASNEQRLPQQPGPQGQPSNDGGGGFFANAPKGDAGAGAGGQQFDKQAYLSGQLGEQWKQYDQKVDNAIAADYKQQINGAVENSHSRNSLQDNVTGQVSQVPQGQGMGMQSMPQAPQGQSYVASNDASGMNYTAQAPAAGQNFARESSPAPSAEHGGHGGHVPHMPQNEAVRQQMDQLANAIDYTPDVNLSRHSHHGGTGGGDVGVPNSVPNQGLQYFAQNSYQSVPDAMTPMQRGQQQPNQLPTNYQGANDASRSGVNSPSSVPVPMQLRTGNVANSRADALKNATRAKESFSGAGAAGAADAAAAAGGAGGKTNKFNSALGKAASVNAAKKAAANAAAGSVKSIRDPMGTVSTGTTQRRLRNKRKWSQEELDAMAKLSGGADPDWEM